jgi:transcription antitermination factor NusA-like protein
MIRIGYLSEFIVTRALPDHESYLVQLVAYGMPALLPKKYAIKQYTLGESGWAAIFNLDGSFTILSQRSPQYMRKILEYLIDKELQETGLRIYRVAKTEHARQFKIAVKGTGEAQDLYQKTLYLKSVIAGYIFGTVYYIKYKNNPVEYVKNALLPAPSAEIRKVIHREEINQMEVYVESTLAGIFFGKQGNNVASASKLTGYSIKIIAV